MMMNKFKLNIYEKRKIVRTFYSDETKLTMEIVRKLADLIDFEVEKNVLEMTKLVDELCNELEDIFGLLFIDITHDEWDKVTTKNIIKLIKQVIDISVSKALMIPTDKKAPNPFIEQKTPTFSESLFRIEYNLCQAFQGYTPDKLDKMSYIKVIEIYSDLRRVQIEDRRIAEMQKELEEKGIKYVPATGNDW